jgi:tRNA threonylcarbamoyladenosine biosynthesis protein TsaE
MASFSVRSRSPEETGRIGAALASRLRRGDTVLLKGDLAAGKTTLVKAVTAALGSTDVVTSPTFALAQFYRAPDTRVLHIDTYRLADIAEYRDLALDEYAEESITLVEWGEKIATEFPCHLEIEFDHGDGDERTLSFASDCDRWTAQMPGLRAELEES